MEKANREDPFSLHIHAVLTVFPASNIITGPHQRFILTVSLDIFSIVEIDSFTASSNNGLIVANSSCSLATSSAVVSSCNIIV